MLSDHEQTKVSSKGHHEWAYQGLEGNIMKLDILKASFYKVFFCQVIMPVVNEHIRMHGERAAIIERGMIQ